MGKLKILFIEPFYGGSHKDFTDGYIKCSRHDIELVTLPSRYWKWRMRGAALHFAHSVETPEAYDLLLTSDMMSLSDLKMMWGNRCPPTAVYFHENQLSYPLPEGEKMDYQFGFTDITTALAADCLIFNSNFHMNSFVDGLTPFIRKMPEYKPLWVVDLIRQKSRVAYPGCSFPEDKAIQQSEAAAAGALSPAEKKIPSILWNHRWEFDKCPEVFFAALKKADTALKKLEYKNPFNLIIMGENFQAQPKAFNEAREFYGQRILQFGFAESKEEYFRRVSESDIAVSTSIQENFGISIIEAVRYGCFPLLPKRLSYPELIPPNLHKEVLYKNEDELTEKLISLLIEYHSGEISEKTVKLLSQLTETGASYAWTRRAPMLDDIIEEITR